MGEDPLPIFGELEQGDEALPRQPLSPFQLVFLMISVERGLLIPDQDPLLQPEIEEPLGLRISPLARLLIQDDPHIVIRATAVILLLHLRGDLIIRLGYHLGEVHPVWVISDPAEGEDLGHLFLLVRSSLVRFSLVQLSLKRRSSSPRPLSRRGAGPPPPRPRGEAWR